MAHLNRLWRSLQGPSKGAHPSLPLLPAAVPAFIRPKIGIALGGGFARGMAHIGVLKVLEEAGIPIDYIAGTSVGAVVGAIYCSGISAQEIGEIAALIRFSDFARHTLSRYGLYSNDRMTALLNRILKAHTFEELKIPLAVTATEFLTGAPAVFTSGELNERVRASCAYPGVFCPVTVDGKLMVDGLLGHSVPATPLKQLGAGRVISVYFSAHWIKSGAPRHVLDIVGQCFSIAQANASSIWRADTDCCIEPDVEAFAYDDFARTPELIRVGEEAARAALPMIQQWLAQPQTALLPELLPTVNSAAPTLAKPLAIAPLPHAAA